MLACACPAVVFAILIRSALPLHLAAADDARNKVSAQEAGSFSLVVKGFNDLQFLTAKPFEMTTEKPGGITKEPVYQTTPRYGLIKLGSGPRSKYIVAVDEPKDADWKIYVDQNQNGDLTAGGNGSWRTKEITPKRIIYGQNYYELRASYGTASKETSSALYTVCLYRYSDYPNPLIRAHSMRVGKLSVDGKVHKAMLIENDADGIYNKRVEGMEDAAKSPPIWLRVDLDDDDDYSSGGIDVRGPFKLAGKSYELKVSVDGAHVSLVPTTKPAMEWTPTVEPILHLLKPGVKAPDFLVEKSGGGDLKLSDYKGKILVLYCSHTWGRFIDEELARLEADTRRILHDDAKVVYICVWEDREEFKRWIQTNGRKYSFLFAFDPAGAEKEKSLLVKRFKIYGTPARFVIDKNGYIAASFNGFNIHSDNRLQKALAKLSVRLNEHR